MSESNQQLKLSIIIVNYNVKYFLEQCLCSVMKACRNMDAQVFVIDNNSTDGSKEFFTGKVSSVKFIWNAENVGFAKANNQAVPYCTGEYILFLNPDTIVAEDCFELCIQFIQSQQKPGALGIRLIDGAGNFLKESKRAFPSPLTSLFKLSGLTSLFPHSKIFSRYYLGNLDEYKNHEVDVLVGAFMLIPKSVLDAVGSFDETFFMYGEDIDLSYRIQKAGFKNYYFSETTAIHFKGESTKKGSPNYIRIFYNAMSVFVKKHYSGGTANIYNILMQFAILIRAIFSGIGSFFKMVISSVKKLMSLNKNEKQKVLLVGSENDRKALLALMQKKSLEKEVVDSSPIPHSSSELSMLIKKYSAEEIIFCEGGLSFKEIIYTIQQLSITVSYYFYASGSNSIIGSDSKDSSGDCIILD